jgi:excisionase family DNA binding protein
MSSPKQSPDVLTVDEAAALLRISRGKAYEAVRTGEVPSVRVGRCIRIPRVALERMLEDGAGK